MRALQSALAIFVALLAALLYSRAGVLSLMYTNAPSRIQTVNKLGSIDVKFADVLRNCEDAVLDTAEGFALLSCDPGRDSWNTVMGPLSNSTSPAETGIYIWHYADPASVPKKLTLLDFNEGLRDFHPLGIEYQPASKTITIINLASSASRIETFKLFAFEAAASFVRTVEHPQLSAPNSVVAISPTEYLITNDHYFSARSGSALTSLETYIGISGGSIVYVKYDESAANKPSVVKSLARLNFANGIALLNETTVAVASSGLASVSLYAMSKANGELTPKLTYYRAVNVPFHADNLSVDGNSKLLIAGHPHAPSMKEVAKNAARCNSESDQQKEHCDYQAPSGIAEWSEQAGLMTLYLGFDYQSSSTALRDGGRQFGLATGLYAKGLMTWQA